MALEARYPLGEAGFEKGDLILAVNKQPVAGVDSFAAMIEKLPADTEVSLLALDHRTGNTVFVNVKVK